MKQLLILLSVVLLAQPLYAQPAITGHVYDLQSGDALEGVRVQLKNRAGLEIGTVQPAYTNDDGYFEFAGLPARDYRMEITHTFETANGPMGLRLFTVSDVIALDTSDVALTVGMSSWSAEHFQKNMKLMQAYQENTKRDPETGKVRINLPDSSIARLNRITRRNHLMRSRIIGPKNHEYRILEHANPVSNP